MTRPRLGLRAPRLTPRRISLLEYRISLYMYKLMLSSIHVVDNVDRDRSRGLGAAVESVCVARAVPLLTCSSELRHLSARMLRCSRSSVLSRNKAGVPHVGGHACRALGHLHGALEYMHSSGVQPVVDMHAVQRSGVEGGQHHGAIGLPSLSQQQQLGCRLSRGLLLGTWAP